MEKAKETQTETLKFAPWTSNIEVSFYAALASRKLDHDKLDDAARRVLGRYEIRPADPPERSTQMHLHGNAFTTNELPADHYRAEGMLKNTNTIEEYKNLDRTAIIEQAGRTVWDAIVDGSIYSCPSLLASFYAIFFADLKKYKFTYHFAFPALHSTPLWQLRGTPRRFTSVETPFLVDAVQTWRYSVDPRQHGFFLAKRDRSAFGALAPPGRTSTDDDGPHSPGIAGLGYHWGVGSLSSYEAGFFNGVAPEDRFVCFADPSTYAQNPGWMLRNLLALVRKRWSLSSFQVLCYRDRHYRRDQPASIILDVHADTPPIATTSTTPDTVPKTTGWERNENNKLNSRTVNLAEYLDPTHLASQSVDLNLKLMKWRIAPALDLSAIQQTSCLLLGAGTLGSYVSRALLGWGVRRITLLDNGRVSYSNPVRQPLFDFADCAGGGLHKATRGAAKLREIYPGVDAQGHVLSVPMAGHPVVDEVASKGAFDALQRLIDEHDAIFLLLDSREARWLPTLMGKAAGKIVLNAALGFDSFVAMRHGARLPPNVSHDPAHGEPNEVGCYFCNDVVAPADSMKSQTLDQQCTTTRPGVAPMASAIVTELLVSVLQHPLRAHAPAPASRAAPRQPPEHPLGLVPHMIRGALASWETSMVRGPAFPQCSACSPAVLQGYEAQGWGFVRRCLEEKGFVERVSGLEEVQRRAEEMARQMEEEEEDDGDDFGGGLDDEGELL